MSLIGRAQRHRSLRRLRRALRARDPGAGVRELEAAFRAAWADAGFRLQLDTLLAEYAGRPSPVTECHNLAPASACACC